MRGVPTQTLYDMGTNEGFEGSDPILPAPKLIDPYIAIQWVATGTFVEPSGPRDWYSCLENDLMIEGSNGEGRRELAEEIIVGAIASGALRCAFVSESAKEKKPWERHTWSRLSIVDPRLFEQAGYVAHEWESEGIEIVVGRDEDDENMIQFAGFWLFWDEVQRLRPAPRNGGESDRADEQPTPLIALPTISSVTMLPPRSADALEYQSSSLPSLNRRRGKGRPAGKNGEPIAMFVLRIQSEGVEKFDGLSDDALGAMLREEYFRLSLKQPEITNAARDARGAVRALMKMQAKIDLPESE